MIQHSAACERNQAPILDILKTLFIDSSSVLEVSSGTGMHAVHMAAGLPHLQWQPSDISPHALLSIDAWRALQPAANLKAAVQLDVRSQEWDVDDFDAIFNANMIHIAPWEVTQGLLAGAGRLLPSGGLLVMYGPYKINGTHTAPSNARFDLSLQQRDPSWGVRDLAAVVELAAKNELDQVQLIAMPANNQMVVYRRR